MSVSCVQTVWHYTWGVLSLGTREHVYLAQTERQGGRGKGDERKTEKEEQGGEAGYGNRDALGIEEKGGCCLFLGPDNMRERGPHSSPPSLSIPSFPTFLLGTCNRHSGRLCVPRIPIREEQLDTGRLTFFCLLLSAEQRQDKDWVSDRTRTHAHFRGHTSQDRQ